MPKSRLPILVIGCVALLLAGCPKGNDEAKQGRDAELLNDYDNALIHYQRALREDPRNTEYKLRAERLRFQAASYHVTQGLKIREKGDLQQALAEFQKAAAMDPSNALAAQEVQRTLEMIGAKMSPGGVPPTAPPTGPRLMEGPPQLMPLSHAPIKLVMTNDAKIIFETIGQLSGLTVIFDGAFTATPHRIKVDLPSVTYQEALDITALQCGAYWKPITSNVILVADQTKRKDYEEEIIRTFRLSNVTSDKDLTDIVNAIRVLFNTITHINSVPSQNAIVIRDTPDRVRLVGEIIDSLDKAKPEVVIQIEILQARRDRLRDLGILPSTSLSVNFAPPGTSTSTGTGTGTGTATTPSLPLSAIRHISTADYTAVLPSATVNVMLNDANTKLIQNPELRSVDGVKATLRIGDKVPIATGSFGAGIATGGVNTGVNALVNTQFNYQDVGVNIDILPRILANRDVAMHVRVEVSSVTGTVNLGGINQPIISQRVADHDVRLMDGESNVLAGFIEHTDTNNVTGWPGLAKIPILKYFFSSTHTEDEENEILIVLTPHVVRMPQITAENLRSIASGTDANPQAHEVSEPSAQQPPLPAPQGVQQNPQQTTVTMTPGVPVIAAGPTVGAPPPVVSSNPNGPAALRFEPANLNLKPGEVTTIGIVVENVHDLSSLPLLLQYDPKVISVEEVRHGGFLSGDTQEALVQRIDQPNGQVNISAMRMQNLPGVSGNGTVVAIVVKALAPGNTQLSIVQVNAKDSQLRPIPLVTAESTIRVHQ
jgi:general secretion pathway protein D